MSAPASAISREELLDALARLDAALATVRRNAGHGCSPECERALDAQLRGLRAMLGGDLATLAEDVIDAAKRALESAAPDAPLLMLSMAQDRLHAAVKRHTPLPMPRAA